jgi:hypothetical protein
MGERNRLERSSLLTFLHHRCAYLPLCCLAAIAPDYRTVYRVR